MIKKLNPEFIIIPIVLDIKRGVFVSLSSTHLVTVIISVTVTVLSPWASRYLNLTVSVTISLIITVTVASPSRRPHRQVIFIIFVTFTVLLQLASRCVSVTFLFIITVIFASPSASPIRYVHRISYIDFITLSSL